MTNEPISPAGLVPVAEMQGDNSTDTVQLEALWRTAEQFVHGFSWCARIREAYLALGVPKVIGVFLLQIVPTRPDVDEWLWVVVGDLPPAYLSTDYCRTTSEAIKGYSAEMSRWVQAVEQGRSVEDMIPVDAPPTHANAAALKARLALLDRDVLAAVDRGELLPLRRRT